MNKNYDLDDKYIEKICSLNLRVHFEKCPNTIVIRNGVSATLNDGNIIILFQGSRKECCKYIERAINTIKEKYSFNNQK